MHKREAESEKIKIKKPANSLQDYKLDTPVYIKWTPHGHYQNRTLSVL